MSPGLAPETAVAIDVDVHVPVPPQKHPPNTVHLSHACEQVYISIRAQILY